MRTEGATPARLQELIDQAAVFHLYVAGAVETDGIAIRDRTGAVIGVDSDHAVHRFEIDLAESAGDRMVGRNSFGERLGHAALRCTILPEDFCARPDREPPPTRLDAARSQRFSIQEATFTFGDGRSGFRLFGAGRTFPMRGNGEPALWAAAVANIEDGFGTFRNRQGNVTMCGDFSAARGFGGHLIVRVLDADGGMRAEMDAAPVQRAQRPDPDATYLTWIAQKARDSAQENTVSLAPGGSMRGLNIPVDLKRVSVGLAGGSREIRAREMHTGDVIGLEVGFGRESVPRTRASGSALLPNRFEGVSLYRFYGPGRCTIGTLTANVLEGRSFSVRLPDAPQEPALRFGFFGPVVHGAGCFHGASGLLYGAAGSVFSPPPYPHRISNLYVLRLADRGGRFRGV